MFGIALLAIAPLGSTALIAFLLFVVGVCSALWTTASQSILQLSGVARLVSLAMGAYGVADRQLRVVDPTAPPSSIRERPDRRFGHLGKGFTIRLPLRFLVRKAMMSRLQRVAVLSAGVALALGVLDSASAQTDKYGGTLTVGLRIGPDALDPTLSMQFTNTEVYRTFCEKLYDLDGKAQVVPQLAAALPVISKDKLTYTIRLRKGIVFNDGTPFNADAVVTTLERNLTHPESRRASDLDSVGSVTASGPYTVVLHLKSPSTPLLDYLSTAATAILSPSQLTKLGDDFATNPICVGPFSAWRSSSRRRRRRWGSTS